MKRAVKIYWADREGKSPPEDCTFHWLPFSPFAILPPKMERVETLPSPSPLLPVLRKTFAPDRNAWISGIEKSLEEVRKGELHKVVLARCLTLELSEEPDPFAIAAALQKKAQGAYVFCIQTPHFSFLGASPERLFSRNGRELVSEAVAGTRRRGGNLEEDERLKLQLLSSAKDLREFSFVQTYLQETLEPFSVNPLLFSPLSIHATQNVQHIYSRCYATLKEGISDEMLLHALHPTPALCGMPKQKAWKLIQDLEPFERGPYGGAIGWKTEGSSDWIVGIRSCLIEGKTVKLFTGTGIVEGSDPIEEWDEMDQKLKLYDGIFL